LRKVALLSAAAVVATLVFVFFSAPATVRVGHGPTAEVRLPLPGDAAGPSTVLRAVPLPHSVGEDQGGVSPPSASRDDAQVPSTAESAPSASLPDAPLPQAGEDTTGAVAAQSGRVPGRLGAVPDDLLTRELAIPVLGIKPEQLVPAFFDARGERGHGAIDIMAPEGSPVVAVENGTIAKLFISVQGGITIYQFDPLQKYSYYYAHLDSYAAGLKEGDAVKRGQVIGYVGSSGNAAGAGPHLHFAIFLLGPEKRWWSGEALDPYPALTRK